MKRRDFLQILGVGAFAAAVHNVERVSKVFIPNQRLDCVPGVAQLDPELHTITFDNEYECLIPEIWARDSLRILEENMTLGEIVHRDFEYNVDKAVRDRIQINADIKDRIQRKKEDLDRITRTQKQALGRLHRVNREAIQAMNRFGRAAEDVAASVRIHEV